MCGKDGSLIFLSTDTNCVYLPSVETDFSEASASSICLGYGHLFLVAVSPELIKLILSFKRLRGGGPARGSAHDYLP